VSYDELKTYTKAGVWLNFAARVAFIGVLPTLATTKVLVCLLRAITSVAEAVVKNATTLRDKTIQSFFFGFVSGTSTFSPFSEAIVKNTHKILRTMW